MGDMELPDVALSDVLQCYGSATHSGQDTDLVSLPSVSESEEEVALPDGKSPCCKLNCLAQIAADPRLSTRVTELQCGLREAGAAHDRNKLQYDCMRMWQKETGGWRRFSLFGAEPCCQAAIQNILLLSKPKYVKFCQTLSQGFIEPPTDMRKVQNQKGLRQQPANTAAYQLLLWVHENMAEHLAESDSFKKAKISLAQGGPSSSSTVLTDGQGPKEVKWLPPGTGLQELREFALAFNPGIHPPSFATFSRMFHSTFQDWLKVRTEGQHSKCNECEKLKAWRKQCHSKQDVDLVQKHLDAHIASMRADRRADAALNLQAQLTAKGEVNGKTTILSLVIDAMDAAKFKIPRRVEATKEMAALWRPECRFIGCLCEGISENYFIGDCDLVKDANLDLTLLSNVIHEAQAELERRGIHMPDVLRIHGDNASSEVKNQCTFKWCSWLAHREMFREVVVTTFRVGHSHGKIDQRFSECRAVLSESGALETPAEFLHALEKVKAREGRTLKLQHVHSSVDFGKYFAPLLTQISGHTQTKAKKEQGQEAIHCFTFILRKNFQESGAQVEETFPNLPPHPMDVILRCKHYMCSREDSQPPQVVVPHSLMEALDPERLGPTELCGRRSFTKRQVDEFQKTAHVVSQPPWLMHNASAYLLRLVTLNQEGADESWKAPNMTWALKGRRAQHQVPEVANLVCEEDLQFAIRAPARVAVQPRGAAVNAPPPKRRAVMKRPAAQQPVQSGPVGSDDALQPSAKSQMKPATAASASGGAPPKAVVEFTTPAVAKSKATAKSGSKPKARPKKAVGWLPLPPGAREAYAERNHSKCRGTGCPDCRKKVGLILNEDESAWIWDPTIRTPDGQKL